MSLKPVGCDSGRYSEGYSTVECPFHLLDDECPHLVKFGRMDIEYEFVVDLHDHS